NIFPLLEGEEFEELCNDIFRNGLLEPIILYEGKILDGRNRYRACLAADVEPCFETYRGTDPLSYVISRNLKRRHLTTSQRAMVGARISNLAVGSNSMCFALKAILRRVGNFPHPCRLRLIA